MDKIANDFFGTARETEVVAIADDLVAFTSNIGKNWYRQRTAIEDATTPMLIDRLSDTVRRYMEAPTPKKLKDIKTRVAEYIEEFNRRCHYVNCATIDHFHLFRAWRAEQRDTARLAEIDPTIVQLEPKLGGKSHD